MPELGTELNTDVRNFTREFVKHALSLNVDIEIDFTTQQILGMRGMTTEAKEELTDILDNLQVTLLDLVEDTDPILGILQTLNYFREYLTSRTLEQLNQFN
jgi:hypothetical protein